MDYRVYKEEEHTPEARAAAADRRSDSLTDAEVKEHHNPDDIESTPTSRAEVPLAELENKPDNGPWWTPLNLLKGAFKALTHGTSSASPPQPRPPAPTTIDADNSRTPSLPRS